MVTAANDPGANGNHDVDLDLDNDFFRSFTIDFREIVDALAAKGIGFDQDSKFSAAAATSNQIDSLDNATSAGRTAASSLPSHGRRWGPCRARSRRSPSPPPGTASLLGLGRPLLAWSCRR